jgi:hypothetical protein
MAGDSDDIELKFDGPSIRRLAGAPAELVINSLQAIRRMVLIIGMSSEGRPLGQRLKATAKVRREYAVICRPSEEGSHVQPFSVLSGTGSSTPAAAFARERLLEALKAFDSGDEFVTQILPDRRERWFMADAAAGLLPPEDSDIEVTVRPGRHGPFSFKADRARETIERLREGAPPEPNEQEVVGKLKAIDYAQTIITIQPTYNRSIRIDYPLKLEPWLQANVRRRVRLVGDPKLNNVGDITTFSRIRELAEVEPTISPISEFISDNRIIVAKRPISLLVSFDWPNRLFRVQDPSLHIDVYAEEYGAIRADILDELDVLWRNYAKADENDLDDQALALKGALLSVFEEGRHAA